MTGKYIYKLSLILVILLAILLLPRVAYDYSPAFHKITIVLSVLRVLLLFFLWLEIMNLTGLYLRNRNKSAWKKNLLALLLACITLFVILEAVFMFVGRSHYAGYTLNAKVWFFRNWKPINEYGYRDDPVLSAKENHVFVIGDSYTMGHGLKNYRDRYTNLLSEALSARDSTVQVNNMGKNGSDTKDEYFRLLQAEKETNICPKLVILQYFGNDIEEVAKDNGMKFPGFDMYGDLKYGLSNLVESSYFLNYFYWRYPHNDSRPYVEFLIKAYADSAIFNKHIADLQQFVDYSRNRNIPLLVVIYPFLQDENLSGKMYISKIAAYLNENNVQYIDVSDLIRDIPVTERIINSNDAHPNELVNQRIAQKLEEIIIAKNLLSHGVY
jgi:hypothetical protein